MLDWEPFTDTVKLGLLLGLLRLLLLAETPLLELELAAELMLASTELLGVEPAETVKEAPREGEPNDEMVRLELLLLLPAKLSVGVLL